MCLLRCLATRVALVAFEVQPCPVQSVTQQARVVLGGLLARAPCHLPPSCYTLGISAVILLGYSSTRLGTAHTAGSVRKEAVAHIFVGPNITHTCSQSSNRLARLGPSLAARCGTQCPSPPHGVSTQATRSFVRERPLQLAPRPALSCLLQIPVCKCVKL